jgi:hypothetical protein
VIVEVLPTSVSLHPGEGIDLAITLTRVGFDSDMTVAFFKRPAGLVVTSALIAADSSIGTIHVSAPSDAAPDPNGFYATLVVSAPGSGPVASAELRMRVLPWNDVWSDGDMTVALMTNGILAPLVTRHRIFSLEHDGTDDRIVGRRTSDAAPDPGFGDHGIIHLSTAPVPCAPGLLVRDGGNRLLAAGNLRTADRSACVRRMNMDGVPDSSFGSDGTTVVSGIDNFQRLDASDGSGALALLAKNSIVRLFAEGSRDIAFGQPSLGTGGGSFLASDDGAFLLQTMEVERLGADGSPAPSFGDSGYAALDWPKDLHQDPDGSEYWATVMATTYDRRGAILVSVFWSKLYGASFARIDPETGAVELLRNAAGDLVGTRAQPSRIVVDDEGGFWVVSNFSNDPGDFSSVEIVHFDSALDVDSARELHFAERNWVLEAGLTDKGLVVIVTSNGDYHDAFETWRAVRIPVR